MTPATILEHDGIMQPITEWALDYGITPAIIIGRLERGETIADAITTPMFVGHADQRLPIFHRKQRSHDAQTKRKKAPRLITHDGITLNLSQWARRCGLSIATLRGRLMAGWSIATALTAPPTVGGDRRNHANTLPGVVSNFSELLGTGAGSHA